MTVLRLDPLTDSRWQTFLEGARDASIFHHPEWLGLIGRRYGYAMSALCIADGATILAGIPLARVSSRLTGRRLVAVPFSDVCSPAHSPDAGAGATAALVSALEDEHARSGLPVEVRAPLTGVANAHVVAAHVTHRLALEPDADAVLARASKSQVRRALNKATREGVTAEHASDRAALATFYRLHERTRRRQCVPVQPRGFILGFDRLFARGLGYVTIARHEGRAIAAAVFLTYGGILTYKYGASDEEHLSLRPNHVIFAAAIRRGCAAGQHELDFGRTDADNTGLARFKRSWGAEEEELPYTYLADSAPRTSPSTAERAVAAAIRRGPPFTGRLIGSLLYKHVG